MRTTGPQEKQRIFLALSLLYSILRWPLHKRVVNRETPDKDKNVKKYGFTEGKKLTSSLKKIVVEVF